MVRTLLIWAWLVSLPLATAARVQMWQGDVPLWASAAALAPYKPRVLLNYGTALEHQKSSDPRVFVLYVRAAQFIDLRPNQRTKLMHEFAEQNLGVFLHNQIVDGLCVEQKGSRSWQCRVAP